MTEKTPSAILMEAALEAEINPIRASEMAELALAMLREPSNRQLLKLKPKKRIFTVEGMASTEFIIHFLSGREFTSPTLIGNAYGTYKHGPNHTKTCFHSAWASPRCKKLVDDGVLERNEKGHYRIAKSQAG